MVGPKRTSWTIEELREDLRRFEDELFEADLKPSSVRTYVDRSEIFIRGLAGECEPRGPNTDGACRVGSSRERPSRDGAAHDGP